jgi:hypothetical protein
MCAILCCEAAQPQTICTTDQRLVNERLAPSETHHKHEPSVTKQVKLQVRVPTESSSTPIVCLALTSLIYKGHELSVSEEHQQKCMLSFERWNWNQVLEIYCFARASFGFAVATQLIAKVFGVSESLQIDGVQLHVVLELRRE